MIEQSVVVTNPTGLHARPAALFVQTASKFKSDITVRCGSREANAKSVLNVLTLGAGTGSEIVISANGEDEQEAVAALVAMVQSNMGEAK